LAVTGPSSTRWGGPPPALPLLRWFLCRLGLAFLQRAPSDGLSHRAAFLDRLACFITRVGLHLQPHPKSGAQACSPGDNLCPEATCANRPPNVAGRGCTSGRRAWRPWRGRRPDGQRSLRRKQCSQRSTGGIPRRIQLRLDHRRRRPIASHCGRQERKRPYRYFNYDQGKIRYATNRSGSWVIADIATANLAPNNIGASLAEATPSIAVDSNGMFT